MPTEVPKDEMIFFFFFFSLYRDEKAPLKLKFSYVLLHEFKPFGEADNLKWKLNARMSLSPTLGK